MRGELISSSGLVIIRRLISYLPPWAMTFVLGQMVWQWIGLGVYFFFGASAILLIYKCSRTVLAAVDSKLDSSLGLRYTLNRDMRVQVERSTADAVGSASGETEGRSISNTVKLVCLF